MSSVEKAAAVENGEWRQRRLGPEQGSVFPKKRKLVKTMILEALFSSRPSLKSKQIAKPPCSKRVQPTVRGSTGFDHEPGYMTGLDLIIGSIMNRLCSQIRSQSY
ncbi:hypothetical protein YC2023_083917 [Brassica napus]